MWCPGDEEPPSHPRVHLRLLKRYLQQGALLLSSPSEGGPRCPPSRSPHRSRRGRCRVVNHGEHGWLPLVACLPVVRSEEPIRFVKYGKRAGLTSRALAGPGVRPQGPRTGPGLRGTGEVMGMESGDSFRPRLPGQLLCSKTSAVMAPGRRSRDHFLPLSWARSQVERLHGSHVRLLHFSFWKTCGQRLAQGSAL